MLLTTPPFAPNTVRILHSLGLVTLDDLRAVGPVQAFLLLKAAGLTVTRSVLWQLAAACYEEGGYLNEAEKQALLSAVRQHPPVALFPPLAEMENMMRQALAEAAASAAAGEVPVGAVVVHQGEIIARAHNCCIGAHDVSQHAEIRALSQAGTHLGNYRLSECDVYVTLEPCLMCAGALMQARVRRLVYGATEPKTGAAGSVLNVFADPQLNRHTAVKGGILAKESQQLLQHFFQTKRQAG